jgi:hypothetical protein
VERRQLEHVRGSENVIQPSALTGWGTMVTTWTPQITAHAVAPDQVDRCRAVCGAALVVIDLSRPWSGEDTVGTDACRRCTELIA